MVIAIDGPGGVGKSTVTRRVAAALGIPELNTGAYYRAAALAAIEAGANLDDEAAVVGAIAHREFAYDDDTMYLDGRNVSVATRSPEVTAASSAIATLPGVRRLMVEQQRRWVEVHAGRAVAEGRDIGTVVFPDAAVKVFLDARPEVRAARRAADREVRGVAASQVHSDLATRDARDSEREASPLRPADDAVVIDTSDLTIDEVVSRVLELAAAS